MICDIGGGVVLFILTAIEVKNKSVLLIDIVDVVCLAFCEPSWAPMQ